MASYLSRILVKNFRLFAKGNSFQLNPITVLTGTNNSGKSSFIKALLLLHENANRNGWNFLDFDIGKHNLGSFSLTKSKISDKPVMQFTLTFKDSGIYLANNIFVFPNITAVFLEYEESNNDGKLVRFNWRTTASEEDKEVLLLLIQYPSKNLLDENTLSFNFNLRYFIYKYSDELEKFKKYPLENPIFKGKDLGWSDDDAEKPFSFDFSEPAIENNPIPQKFQRNFKTIVNINVLKDALNNYQGNHDFSRFLIILNEYLIDHFSSISFDKKKWESLHNANEIYGSMQEVTISDMLLRYFEWYQNDLFRGKKIKNLKWGEKLFNYYFSQKNKEFDYISFNDIHEFDTYFNTIKEFEIKDLVDKDFILFFEDFLSSLIKEKISDYSASINIEFLEAVKANSRRIYTSESQGTNFNELLKKFKQTKLNKHAEEFLIKWIKLFEIGDNIKVQKVLGTNMRVVIFKNNSEIDLADLGYGIVQFIPILIEIVCSFPVIIKEKHKLPKKTHRFFFIIEEPETNFHPRFQSLLADFFTDALKYFDVRFILETHSEYLIRKLQYLTAKKEIKPEDSVIYYFNHPDEVAKGAEQVKELHIREDGMMDGDFGPGFFDESTRLTVDLLKLQNKN